MEFNLDYLKFHSFKFNKKIKNEWFNPEKKIEKYNKIKADLKAKINHYKEMNYSEMIKDKKNNHKISDEKSYEIIEKIIKECHPNLYKKFNQNFIENSGSLNLFQIKIISYHRLICYYNKSKDELIPLLFDINHIFHPSKNKKYDNRIVKFYSWDFKEKQEEIKKELLEIY